MKKNNLIILIILIIGIIGIIGIVIVIIIGVFLFAGDCFYLNRYVINLIHDKNYCNLDADCLVTEKVMPMCGCYSIINKDANLFWINTIQTLDGFRWITRNCGALSCAPCSVPKQEQVKCINKKCIIE